MDCWIRTLLVFLAIFVPQAKAADKITYFVPDHAGSPIVAMDEKGEVLWRAHRDPWGVRLDNEGPETRSPGYAGHAEDAESNLVYMGARWYEPASGRFTGVDPVGPRIAHVQSFNRYMYGNNSPYIHVDPDGRWAESIWDAMSIGIGIQSLSSNISEGSYLNAALDGVGLALDVVAAVTPVVPGGASAGIQAVRTGEGIAEAKWAVIGEGQVRVDDYASRHGGYTITQYMQERNLTWSREVNDMFMDDLIRSGSVIEDIGPDFSRRRANRVDPERGRPPSEIYGRERQMTKGYENYVQSYTREGKYDK